MRLERVKIHCQCITSLLTSDLSYPPRWLVDKKLNTSQQCEKASPILGPWTDIELFFSFSLLLQQQVKGEVSRVLEPWPPRSPSLLVAGWGSQKCFFHRIFSKVEVTSLFSRQSPKSEANSPTFGQLLPGHHIVCDFQVFPWLLTEGFMLLLKHFQLPFLNREALLWKPSPLLWP